MSTRICPVEIYVLRELSYTKLTPLLFLDSLSLLRKKYIGWNVKSESNIHITTVEIISKYTETKQIDCLETLLFYLISVEDKRKKQIIIVK